MCLIGLGTTDQPSGSRTNLATALRKWGNRCSILKLREGNDQVITGVMLRLVTFPWVTIKNANIWRLYRHPADTYRSGVAGTELQKNDLGLNLSGGFVCEKNVSF